MPIRSFNPTEIAKLKQLMNEGKEIYLVDLEDKDPSEMGFKAITNLIQKTTPLSQYDLMAKKLQFV